MSKPLVSVITTVYNCEKFIEKSLRSIFNQTFQDFEFIIYNDSSTDRTWEIIDNVLRDFGGKHTSINKVVGEVMGCAAGRNRAIEQAKGKYIAIQDGDDISYNDRLEKEVEFMESNSDIFCVGSWADLIDEKGEKIGVFDYPPENHNDAVLDIYKMKNPIIDPSSMFRKDIFNKMGHYSVKWDLIPDLYLWVSAMLGGHRFANLPHKLISYRKHKNSVMSKCQSRAIRQHRLLYDTMISKHKKEGFLYDI